MSSPEISHREPPAEIDEEKIPLVVIVGPTAAGKTEIAIQLAERLNGEIVSADSRLFYRGMDIGTAKPSAEQLLRVPHHLIDVANPDETWSLAVFQAEANKIIRQIHLRHRLPFLVGGTGQFVHAITEGWRLPSAHPNPELRAAIEAWGENIGAIGLHARLAVIDPTAATSIDPSNVRRTVRALEVSLTTGRRFSEQRKSGFACFKTLIMGVWRTREELYQRIDERIMKMLEEGFVDEVRKLLNAGYRPELPTMSAIGYGEITAYLNGLTTLDEAILLMKRRTRIFVRRQGNWFKENDPNIHWFRANDATEAEMGSMITNWLESVGAEK